MREREIRYRATAKGRATLRASYARAEATPARQLRNYLGKPPMAFVRSLLDAGMTRPDSPRRASQK